MQALFLFTSYIDYIHFIILSVLRAANIKNLFYIESLYDKVAPLII
nr:hypothetical protein BAR15_120444 [Bartonella sp. AR 15-3]